MPIKVAYKKHFVNADLSNQRVNELSTVETQFSESSGRPTTEGQDTFSDFE